MARPAPRALILDVYGAYVRELGGWLAVADLVSLMGDLGQEEQAVRSATSRMKKAGLLRSHARGGVAGYALTEEALTILEEGDERIFPAVGGAADLADGWVVAVFSVPERDRGRRHVLRSRLVWLGFGQVAPGVWIAPRRVHSDARRVLGRLDLDRYVTFFEGHHTGSGETRDLIHRTWDLNQLARAYARFLRRHATDVGRWTDGSGGTERDAFITYTLAQSEWRRLPYLDPGLPPELLPPDWIGQQARGLFASLVEHLQPAAKAHVRSVVNR